jgi:phage gp36-like protein
MARFLKDSDYEDQVRDEIKNLLDNTPDQRKLKQAEEKGIAQMINFLSSRHDVNQIFTPHFPESDPDPRNPFVIMILIDIVLYHLWSKERPGNIPKVRNDRYQDALDWLKAVGTGELISSLPPLPDDQVFGGVQIYSIYKPNNHKF